MAGAKKKVMRRNAGGKVVAKKMMGGVNKAKRWLCVVCAEAL